jgi:hypothetical protein
MKEWLLGFTGETMSSIFDAILSSSLDVDWIM